MVMRCGDEIIIVNVILGMVTAGKRRGRKSVLRWLNIAINHLEKEHQPQRSCKHGTCWKDIGGRLNNATHISMWTRTRSSWKC